ncbi:hypothetical protein [Cellulosimicrobium sp. NPDC057127]|uniref:hypothetical protein n=1 Tax=Cellulosimicrobium sp. NPDC057127 TaxID=3346026 RepID=UPI0036441CBC
MTGIEGEGREFWDESQPAWDAAGLRFSDSHPDVRFTALSRVAYVEGWAASSQREGAPTDVQVADVILATAVQGGREGAVVTAEARDGADYLDCLTAAEQIRALYGDRSDATITRVLAVLPRCEAFVAPWSCADPSSGRVPDAPYAADAYCLPCRIGREIAWPGAPTQDQEAGT